MTEKTVRTRSSSLLAIAALVASLYPVTGPRGETVSGVDISASRRNAIVAAVEKVSPAVVSITVSQRRVVVEEFDPFMSPFFSPFLSPFRKRVVQVAGIGSGVIFDKRGYILTNEHVVRDATAIEVMLPDGRSGPGGLLGLDTRTDIALLEISMKDLPYARLGTSDDLLIGEWVIAIGNPFGFIINDPHPSVGVGVISAIDRTFTAVGGESRVYRGMIQTDAAINQGNSGGPLVNALGEVIGINTFIVSKTGGYQGLGFAIPVNRAKRVVDEILRYGRVRAVSWGFQLAEVNPAVASSLGLKTARGLVVFWIDAGSAAARAGLQEYDLITAVNGEEVADAAGFEVATADVRVSDRVVFNVVREKRDMKVDFIVEEAQR